MSADIRLVKLRRKAINVKGTSRAEGALSMDYFDIIEIEKFDSQSLLQDIMDTGVADSESGDVVSMQSYPLYCSERTILQHKKEKGYGNPFDTVSDGAAPYLSIIQVHITPEVLARVRYKSGIECISAFSDDVHEIMREFMNTESTTVIYRVYQSLSAGDFTVVIRSELVDTSFRISTLFRKRIAKTEHNSGTVPLVLYKTYTILSFYNWVISEEKGLEADSQNKFVVRCCYANKYWSEKSVIEDLLKSVWKAEQKQAVMSLNGRYDFSVDLSENEFHKILPVLGWYKGISSSGETEIREDMENKLKAGKEFTVVDYLCFLIVNGYLSYVNERYLLRAEETESAAFHTISGISIDGLQEREKFLADINDERYCELKRKFDELGKKIEINNFFQKNFNYYFGLLFKLLHLCQTINGLSDTRIYSAILMQQLECVLDGMNHYHSNIEETGNSEIFYGLEEYLRKSVCALDSFARYIRDNNLQSLQTPNYSLQSNASMEKLLIGYGEFLSEIIAAYNSSEFANKISDEPSEFLPILIPALADGEVSIEVMFSNAYLKKSSYQKKLMVVKCSTLQELTDVRGMVTSFFHEIAHQFRYEKREQRNHLILQYGTYAAFLPLVTEISKELCHEITGFNECGEIENILLDAANEAFEDVWKDYMKDSDINKESLSIFQRNLANVMVLIWDNDSPWDAWLRYKRNFLEKLKSRRDTMTNLDLRKAPVQDAIRVFFQMEEKYAGGAEEKELIATGNQLVNAACYLWSQVYLEKNKRKSLSELESREVDKNIQYCREQAIKDNVQDVDSLLLLNNAVLDLRDGGHKYAALYDYRERFLKKWYCLAAKKWDAREPLNTVGAARYLGIDEENELNEKEFVDIMRSRMSAMQDTVPENINNAITAYREQTSDEFMYIMLEMTPFGYLNFMARNISAKLGINVYSEYIIRFLTVILSAEEKEENDESMCRLFNGIYSDLCINLKELLAIYRGAYGGVEYDALENLITDTGEVGASDWQYLLIEKGDGLREACRRLRGAVIKDERRGKDKEELLSELINYQYLAGILMEMIQKYSLGEMEHNGYQYVKKDLSDGALQWREFRNELEKKQRKNPQPWWDYCTLVGSIFNKPSMVYGAGKKNVSEATIEFLQEMYYRNKVESGRNAFRWRKGEKIEGT